MLDRQQSNMGESIPLIQSTPRQLPPAAKPDQHLKVAVIGDVHDLWEPEDEQALRHLAVDLVLFVGDFGNENVQLVRRIAALDLPKAVVFGNHDAWYNATDWGRKKCPYDRMVEDRVQEQIDILGDFHVGYGKLDFPQFNLTVVGSRPFSWGGSEWKHGPFYGERYSIYSFEESTAQIMQGVNQAAHDTLIFIGHCGPLGLGDQPESPCGRDWQPLGGDFGDPDFAAAISQTRQIGKHIPLVAFGHMHHHLRHTKDKFRIPITINPEGTLFLNAACVPRIIRGTEHCRRNFSLVTLEAGAVTKAALVWIDQDLQIVANEVLFTSNQERHNTV